MDTEELMNKMNTKLELESVLQEKIKRREELQAEFNARNVAKENTNEMGEEK